MERLDRNFADFLKLLNSHGVEFLVIGGYAVGYHGFVRATGDLDLFVRRSPTNAASLVQVFRDFGFTTSDLTEQLFLETGKIVRIGFPPVRIEVMNSISGVQFEEAFPKRIEETIDGVRMPFIDLDSLLKNKAASGRMKDLADIEGLTGRAEPGATDNPDPAT
jgi:predicted nucleotidyltransferase